MRLGFVLAMAAAMAAVPYFAFTYGVPADDDFSRGYVRTIDSLRHHVSTYSVSDSYQYEKAAIFTTLGQGSRAVGHFIVTLPQRIHK